MIREWRWNNFNYGLSDSAEFTAVENTNWSFQNGSFAIDTRSEPWFVKLGSQANSSITTDSQPTFFLDLTRYGSSGYRVFTSNGKVYDENGSVLWTQTVSSKTVYGASCMKVSGTLYVYFFTAGKIHKANVAFSTVTEDYATIENYADMKNCVNANGNIYFSSKNIFYEYDDAETLTAKLTLPSNEVISGITVFQDLWKLYVKSENSVYGRQYLYRLADAQYTYETLWQWLPIVAAVAIGGVDYVVTGFSQFYSDLYMVTGTERRLVRWNTEGSSVRRTFLPYITTRLDDIFVGSRIYSSDWSTYSTVMRYGSYYPWMPTALTPEFELWTNIYGIFQYNTGMVIIRQATGGNYSVMYYGMNNTPQDSVALAGEVISCVYDGGTRTSTKSIEELKIALDNDSSYYFPRGGTITVYARKKFSSGWTQLASFSNNQTTNEYTITKAMMSAFGTWNKIEFRVRLTKSDDGQVYSPAFKELYMRYTDNISP